MITAIVQFVKEYKKFILALIVIVVILFIGCYLHTLHSENNSYKSRLQSAKDENRQLLDEKIQMVNSFKDQLQSVKDTNQHLLDENNKKQKEANQINAELQSVKDNNYRLLEENKEFQKKIDRINAELQSVKDDNQKLLEEKKELKKQTDQIIAELRSTKQSDKKILEENNALLKNQEVYSTQVMYIQKWMEAIEKLEEHIHAVIHCSESKKEGSKKHFKQEMCNKIKYDIHATDTSELIVNAIDMVMKFKEECKSFWDALLLKKVEDMKAQQARTHLDEFKKKMQQINEEVSGYKYPKYKGSREDGSDKQDDSHKQWNQEKAVEREGIVSRFISTTYRFGRWVGSMIVGLFWS